MFTSCLAAAAMYGQTSATVGGDRKTAAVTAFNLPAEFQPNRGQAPAGFDFMAQGFGYTLGISPTRAQLALAGAEGRSSQIGISFPGANPLSKPLPTGKMGHTSAYYLGQRAIVGIPSYAQLRFAGLWPGVDVLYYGNNHKLEYDLVVAPQADSSSVRIRFDGVQRVELSNNGDLLLHAENNDVIQQAPVAYQTIASRRVPVDARYVLDSDGTASIALGEYDRSRELVIDPVLVYATGGFFQNQAESATAIATDPRGLATYVTGATIPLVVTQGQPAVHAVYIVKVDNSGAVPVNGGFIGFGAGDGNLYPQGIALDVANNVYVSGYTDSRNALPLANAIQSASGGGLDAFLIKTPPSLGSLLYSSYLGGSGDERNVKVAVGFSTQIAYVVGQTTSVNWPVSGSPAGQNGFIYAIDTTRVPTSGNPTIGRVYALDLGGSGTDAATSVAVDPNSIVYIGGSTTSTDFQPTSGIGYQTSKSNSNLDGFVLKLNAGGSPAWFTYFPGGPVNAIAQFQGQFAYVTGQTSGSIPTTGTAYQPSSGANHAFFARFDTNANLTSALTYASYLGGSTQDAGLAISVPGNGRAYVGGWTTSPNFPVVGSPTVQTSFTPNVKNGFLAYFDPGLSASASLPYSTLIGTSLSTMVTGVSAAVSGEASVSATSTDSNGNNAGGYAFKVGSRIWDKTFFTTQQYADLLDRPPDASGLSYWVNGLNNGLPRENLAASFFTSPEFSVNGLNLIKFYIAVFRRDPDFGGWKNYFDQLIAGRSLDSILNEFLASAEFQNTYGTLSNQAFVNLIYQNVLGRSPDPNGNNYYVGALNSGSLTRSQIMGQFIASAEFNSAVRARAYADLLYMGFLRRSPDAGGLAFYTNVLGDPNNLPGAIADFITSPEYVGRFF